MYRGRSVLSVLLLLAPAALAQVGPLPDVPRDHQAAWAVAMLWRADIVRGQSDGLFHGDEPISELEAITMSARLSAALNNELVIGSGWTVDRYLARFWDETYPARGGVPLPAGHWAAMEWSYLARITPADVQLLHGWPQPLPTRYEAATAAAEVLRTARKAARSRLTSQYVHTMLPDVATNDTMPIDYMPWAEHAAEHGDEAPAEGVLPPGVRPLPPSRAVQP